jgi:ABC-type transport system involved in cytochrome c biogenesis permease subunit
MIASFFALKKREKNALVFQWLGIVSFGVLIIVIWLTLQRPPFKTMGETRMWYSFFLAMMSGITYWRWRNEILLVFVNLLASVFIVINICKPEIQSQVLMPVLQSILFIPHVAIYMFAYAVVGCAFILGVLELFQRGRRDKTRLAPTDNITSNIAKCNQLIKIGTIALAIGMCFGAIWAKKAWGQYWSWDIKETAALITWAIFLLYLHLQKLTKINRKILLIILMIGFLSLQFTWYGVKFLPSAQKSPHLFYNTR